MRKVRWVIKLILFDIDDTLVDHQAGAFQAMQRISSLMIKLNYADDRYDFSEFIRSYETMSHTLWSQFELGEVDISTLLEKRFIYIYDWFGVKGFDFGFIEKEYWNTYIENCSLKNEWLPLLQQLSSTFPLAICSNGMEFVQRRKLVYTNILPFFSHFYFGNYYPDCKPDERFFKKILLDFNLQPENVLMIGDSLNNDISPCKNLGVRTLHYTGSASFQSIRQSIMELING
nr:HAD family hydrolase [Pectobacterium polaris]